MLSISRLNGQRLIVTTPDGIKIEVLLSDARKGRARVGIQAPPNYRIDRAEVLEREALEREHQC
jgi:sRNA-binding carbon storage regulator CsrA